MDTFSISDAAFTGFRIARERPRAVAVWAAVQLAASLALIVAMVVGAGPTVMRLQDMSAAATMDPNKVLALFQAMAPIYGLILVYGLVFNALLYGAMNRAVMRPTEDRFGYFRLGADELRQFALMLLTFGLFLVLYFAVILVAVVLAVIVGLAVKGAAFLVAILSTLAVLCAAVFILVRLSLASALTFATGRVNLFGSWALTRGRFWPIFGTYVLAFAFACVVLVLGFVVSFAVAALVGGSGMASLARPDFTSLATMMTPAMLARMVVSAIITALAWPVILTPPAAIYLRLTNGAA